MIQRFHETIHDNKYRFGTFQIILNLVLAILYIFKISMPILVDANTFTIIGFFMSIAFIFASGLAMFYMKVVNEDQSNDEWEFGLMIFCFYLEVLIYIVVLLCVAPAIPIIVAGIAILTLQPSWFNEKIIWLAGATVLILWGLSLLK